MWFSISPLRIFFILALISEISGSPLVAPPSVKPANKDLSGTHPSTKPSSGTPNVPNVHAVSPSASKASSGHPKTTDVGKGSTKTTPQLPTVSECKAQLKMGDDTSLFYSGPGGYAVKAKKWRNAAKSRSSYKILGEKWVDPKWQDKWQNDEAASKEFFNICSQAMAEASTGTVYVMLPSDTKGTTWQKDTVWDKFEWPHLGSGVTKVIRVNPDNDNSETIKGGSEDSCDVSYKFFFDSFEVRGKNFPDATLGKDGSGLLADLRHCGAVTDWGFSLTPHDVKYQWYASGRLPIGTKNCVGSAVQKAGGSTSGNCHGAG